MRIAEKQDNDFDKSIIYAAAMQYATTSSNKEEFLTEIPGWGYQYVSLYK